MGWLSYVEQCHPFDVLQQRCQVSPCCVSWRLGAEDLVARVEVSADEDVSFRCQGKEVTEVKLEPGASVYIVYV